jgi:Leucine-rich repeat (LRR) protein
MNASAISKLYSTSPALEILDLGENYLPRNDTTEEVLNANSCIVLTGLPACIKLRYFNNTNSEKAFVGINSIKLCPKESISSNSISDIVLEPIKSLQKLKLADNKLLEIPNWCDVEFNSYFPNLVSINVFNTTK